MSLTIENEKQNRMSFLDANAWIIQEDKTFTTSVSRTRTLSRVYTHFGSFFPTTHMFRTVYTNAYTCFRICSRATKLHTELIYPKPIFLKNGYLKLL